MNELTPRNAAYYVGGFFYERDLFPNDVAVEQGGCAASNDAEMFYMLVPDPNGTVNGNRVHEGVRERRDGRRRSRTSTSTSSTRRAACT